MSIAYDEYLIEHRGNVRKGLTWIKHNLPDLLSGFEDFYRQIEWNLHDVSKDTPKEYNAYDNYFYGGQRTKEIEEEFNRAWLHHIHNNPHHWQYWVLINDEAEDGVVALRIPYRYVIEMICDWWAFSWRSGDLYEIFDWYDKHKGHMKLHEDSRDLIEEILGRIRAKLDEYAEVKEE